MSAYLPDDDFEPDSHGLRPWDEIDAALDAGGNIGEAPDRTRYEAGHWLIAVSGYSREVYRHEYERKRSRGVGKFADRKRDRHQGVQAAYMRAYRARRKLEREAA